MPYNRKTWVPGDTLNTAELNRMEGQYESALAEAGASAGATVLVTGAGLSSAHHELVRTAIVQAQDRDLMHVTLPALPDGATWVFNDLVEVPSNITIDATAAPITQTKLNTPVFYIAPPTVGVKIHAKKVFLTYPTGTRPTQAELTAAGPAGNALGTAGYNGGAGVLVYGTDCEVTGHFEGFRNGVRWGTWNGVADSTSSTGLGNEATGNKCNATFKDVDFGVVFAQQNGIDIWAEGSYVMTVGSPDRPHAVYGTGPSENFTVNGRAFDSTGGVAFLFKQAKNLKSTSLIADNCPAILDVQDERGPLEFGDVFGTNLTCLVDGALAEPVRGATVNGPSAGYVGVLSATKSIRRLRLELAAGIPVAQIRAATLDQGWTIGSYDIVYNTNEVSETSRIFHIYKDRTNIGKGKITNLGTGGVMGFRYTTGTQHSLDTPTMDGVTIGVQVDATATVNSVTTAVTNSVFSVEPTLVRLVGTGTAGALKAGTNVPIRMLSTETTNSVTGGVAWVKTTKAAWDAMVVAGTTVPGTFYYWTD